MQKLFIKKQCKALRDKLDKVLHVYYIGKRSCDRQFLFEAGKGDLSPDDGGYYRNTNSWSNNLQSLKEWLSKPEYVIQDEYGEIFTPEKFWNEEVGESLYNNPEKYINCEQYYKDKPRYFDNREFTSSDGLRFSI